MAAKRRNSLLIRIFHCIENHKVSHIITKIIIQNLLPFIWFPLLITRLGKKLGLIESDDLTIHGWILTIVIIIIYLSFQAIQASFENYLHDDVNQELKKTAAKYEENYKLINKKLLAANDRIDYLKMKCDMLEKLVDAAERLQDPYYI